MRAGTLEGPAAGSEVMTGMNACDADGVVAVDLLSKGDCCDAALNYRKGEERTIRRLTSSRVNMGYAVNSECR